jgi:hypothetical protein
MYSKSMCKFYMQDRNIVMLFQKSIMNPLFFKNSSIFYNMIIIKLYCNMNNWNIDSVNVECNFTF